MTDLISRLEALTAPSRELDACLEWPGARDKGGRGRIWVGDKLMLAHRAVWEKINGPIPAGKILCHHCDNPGCVNPKHLYVGTNADNGRECWVTDFNSPSGPPPTKWLPLPAPRPEDK